MVPERICLCFGRTWHASRLKNSSQAEAICWSTRNTLPLPQPEKIRSSLPLTIRGFCLCPATFKLYLILAGRSRPRNGEPCSSGSSRGNRSVTSPVITACRMRRSGECCASPLSGMCEPGSPTWSVEHAASTWADNGRSGSGVCSWSKRHISSVPQEGAAHTASSWTAGGSQVGKQVRREAHAPVPSIVRRTLVVFAS